MADGDTNIKVVVRCRPLNTRGISVVWFEPPPPSHTFSIELARGAKTSFACMPTRPFSTPPTMPLNKTQNVLLRERPCPLALTRVTGVQAPETTLSTVHSRPCTTTSAKNSWITVLLASMLVSSLVSLLPQSSHNSHSHPLPRWSNRCAPIIKTQKPHLHRPRKVLASL